MVRSAGCVHVHYIVESWSNEMIRYTIEISKIHKCDNHEWVNIHPHIVTYRSAARWYTVTWCDNLGYTSKCSGNPEWTVTLIRNPLYNLQGHLCRMIHPGSLWLMILWQLWSASGAIWDLQSLMLPGYSSALADLSAHVSVRIYTTFLPIRPVFETLLVLAGDDWVTKATLTIMRVTRAVGRLSLHNHGDVRPF